MQVWLPSIRTHSPLLSLQAIPTRSASGSLAITMSASILLANLMASSKASAFSGLGLTTVGKLPSFTICSGTQCTFSNPHNFNDWGINIMPVPCIGVYTIFKSFCLAITSGSIESVLIWRRYSSSISFPMISIKFLFPSNLISSGRTFVTSSIIPWSCGAKTCAPSSQ